jgi:hypothetical protein
MTNQEWQPIAERLRAAWPDFPLDDVTTSAYVSALGDVDARAVSAAVDDLLREPREHAPPPGVIRERALGGAAPAPAPAPPQPPPAPAEPRRGGGRGWLWALIGVLAAALIAALVVVGVRNDDSPASTVTQSATVTAPPSSVTVVAPERTVTQEQTVTQTQTTTRPSATSPAATAP